MLRHWKEASVALVVIAACGWGVLAQFEGHASVAAPDIRPMAIGEDLHLDVTLRDVETPPKPRSVLGSLGRTATVFYTWSAACPCILDLEPRLRTLHERFGKAEGIAWIAVAGEPGETVEELRTKRDVMHAFYPVLRDPDQLVCRRLDLHHAGQAAVLDAQGRLVYRGAIDAHWKEGHAEFLSAALEAVVKGRRPAVTEEPRRYGCEFDVPASCLAAR